MANDILLITLSICSVVLTVFICRTLYYLTRILQDVVKTLDWFQKTLSGIDSLLNLIKDKLDNATTYLASITELAKMGLEFYKDIRKNNKSSRKKTTNEDDL